MIPDKICFSMVLPRKKNTVALKSSSGSGENEFATISVVSSALPIGKAWDIAIANHKVFLKEAQEQLTKLRPFLKPTEER